MNLTRKRIDAVNRDVTWNWWMRSAFDGLASLPHAAAFQHAYVYNYANDNMIHMSIKRTIAEITPMCYCAMFGCVI